jgi:5-hydroxyisourate hydrolase-like protein (transthyretin family)
MTTPTFVQGDTGPSLVATLHDQADPTQLLDLTDATGVRFQMRKADDKRYSVNAPATIVDASTGRVRYAWGPNDLAVPGDYEIQFEVTYVDGMVQTTATPALLIVRRQ